MPAVDEFERDFALSHAGLTRYQYSHAENVHQNAVHNFRWG